MSEGLTPEIRAAVAERDAEWREALEHDSGGQWWMCGNCNEFLFPDDDGKLSLWGESSGKKGVWLGCAACAPLRKLIAATTESK